MNIFAVDLNPSASARALHDAHVVKMATESAQILSTLVHPTRTFYRPLTPEERGTFSSSAETPSGRFLRDSGARIYLPTHPAHPCTVWASLRLANWQWLYAHTMALCTEYRRRFGRVHGAQEVALALSNEATGIGGDLQPFAQAMPEQYRGPDAPAAYRRYYIAEKLAPGGRPARWTRRDPPNWLRGVPGLVLRTFDGRTTSVSWERA